jgi:DNA repair exonuclease SbcCD nuclease subunit
MELSARELSLLPAAVKYSQEVDGEVSRDDLRRVLKCGSDTAQRLQTYLLEVEAVKVANRLEALPVRAEARAHIQYALGDTTGTITSHVLRENARLTRRLAKKEHEKAEERDLRSQEILEEIEALKKLAKDSISTVHDASLRIARSKELTGNMLEVNLPDAHFGKLAWPQETGGAPYDSKITQETYAAAIDALIERTKMYKYDEVVYVIGNDILNANNADSETAKGTIVSSDGRYQKTFWKARNTVIETIKKLLKIAPVMVMAIYGNHDTLSSWHLADSIECYFHDNPDVKVQNDPTYRKYYEYGRNMIMFTHGDKGKRDDYPALMAAERSAMFGRTQFREVHCGHTHETKMEEYHGVRVRILPALCPADSWHAENGYVGNLRNAEAYIWNKNEGLIGTAIYNVDSQPEITTKREIVKRGK